MQLSDRIGRRIKLSDLHVLLTVAQAGSMNKAARLLNTTQPAVSRSIGTLEQTIGVRLLDRRPQGVEPTDYGRAVLDGGAAVFDDLRQTLKSVEFLADPTAGSVRIGCSPLLAASFVSAVIDRVCRRYPRIAFDLVSAPVETVHRDLSERRLDFLITRKVGPVGDARLSFEVLFDDSLVVVAGARHPLARRRKVARRELAGQLWVLPPPGLVLGSTIVNAFRALGLVHDGGNVTTASPEVRMSLLATGRFLTIFPASALRFTAGRSELKVLPVALPIVSVPNGIVTLKNRTLSPVAQLVIGIAREVAKPLKKGT
jgi:DNA-binding transcriptional LysR family regulator